MQNLIQYFSLQLNWIGKKVSQENPSSFLNNIKWISNNLHSSPTEKKTRNESGHFIYAICLIQERLFLIDVFEIHSL